MVWPFPSSNERLRREAAAWVAKLQGPNAETSRAEFERWYSSSSDRAAAYERVRARYEAAGLLRQSDVARSRTVATRRRQGARPLRLALAAAGCAIVLAIVLLAVGAVSPRTGPALQAGQFAAAPGVERRVALADGSQVTLSPGSAVAVDLRADERSLRLLDGEARFAVAHERRRFVVLAGRTEIVAHGTEFIVRVGQGGTTVSLITGAVEVSYPSAVAASGSRLVTRLRPGERLVVREHPGPGGPRTRLPLTSGTSPAMLQFDGTPLGEAVAEANRAAEPKIRLDDPSIAGLRVTGAFRSGDTRGLAASLAAAFGLRLERASDGSLLLRRAPAPVPKP